MTVKRGQPIEIVLVRHYLADEQRMLTALRRIIEILGLDQEEPQTRQPQAVQPETAGGGEAATPDGSAPRSVTHPEPHQRHT